MGDPQNHGLIWKKHGVPPSFGNLQIMNIFFRGAEALSGNSW